MTNNFKYLHAFIIIFSFFLFSCKKEIDQPAMPQEEIATVANQTHGHLMQTKTYTSEVIQKWIDLQWRVLPTQSEEDSGLGFIPPRFYAYCGIALYESVLPGMPSYQTLSGQLTNMPQMKKVLPGTAYHWPTVANVTLAYMTRKLLPNVSINKKSSIDSLESALNSVYQMEVNSSTFQRSFEFGEAIANDIYAWSRTDGFYSEYPPYQLPVGPGLWEPTPPGFFLPGLNAYNQYITLLLPGLRNANSLSPPQPYSIIPSSVFFNDMKDVYDASLTLTTEQRAQALYWRGTPSGSAPAQWFNILRKILFEQGEAAMLDKATLAYCRMGIALSDAAISNFKESFTYNQIRPITYIRNVIGHDTWNTLFPTPAYPGFPQFHATIAGASTAIFSLMFGNDYHLNTDGTHHLGLPGFQYNSFEEALMHASYARFYAGVATKPAVEAGILLGKKTFEYMNSKIEFKKP